MFVELFGKILEVASLKNCQHLMIYTYRVRDDFGGLKT